MRNRDHGFFFSDQILEPDFRLFINDLGPAGVAVLLLDIPKLLHDELAQLYFAGKDFLQFGDFFTQFLQFILDFLPLKAGQALQLHLEDCLSLNFSKFKLRD